MIWIYNRIVENKNQIKFAEKSIDVQLKKRFDVLPNIASTVKKFLEHESNLHTKITELREKYDTTTDKNEKTKLETSISGALNDILIRVENYPEIKSEESILHLQRTINELSEQISAAQRAFNASVLNYNNSIKVFPNNLIAKLFTFEEENYLTVIPEFERDKISNIDINQLL